MSPNKLKIIFFNMIKVVIQAPLLEIDTWDLERRL